MQCDRRALTQAQQAGDLVDLTAGQHYGLDRTAAQIAAGVQCRGGADLRAEIGGCVEQRPGLAVGRHCEPALGARFHPRIAGPRQGADRTIAIPLRISAARRRAEHNGAQALH
jgi:hypothetical protein